MHTEVLKYFKKGDLAIAVVIMALSFSPFAFFRHEKSTKNPQIVIMQDNAVLGRYELNEKENSQFIDFEFVVSSKTYIGTIETKNSKVRLLRLPEEAVPRSIHSDMSWIDSTDKIIVALPAKLAVYLENAEKTDYEVDAIVN